MEFIIYLMFIPVHSVDRKGKAFYFFVCFFFRER